MNFLKKAIIFVIAPLLFSFSAKADLKVVTTIKPLHSLISSVMEGVGKPSLIIEGTSNPHTFVFKPSHAQMLEAADIVFWIGEDLEAFMEKPLESLASNATKISFMELSSIEKLKFREENIFDDHDDHDGHEDEHEGHDDHDHDGHKEDDHDDHGHDDHDGHEDEHEGHDDHHGHHHGEFDAHIWLDPSNAIEMVLEISHELSEIDPENAAQYEENSNKTIASLNNLINEINSSIPKDASYVVFHDAYQYFETSFDFPAAGAISLGDATDPSAARIAEIQDRVKDEGINCVLSEPQYNANLVATVLSGTDAKTGVIDPLGLGLEPGPKLYGDLIRNMGKALAGCL